MPSTRCPWGAISLTPSSMRAACSSRRFSLSFITAFTGPSAPHAGVQTPSTTVSNINESSGRTASVLELRDVDLVPLVHLGAKRDQAARRAGDVVVHLGPGAHQRARAAVDVGDVDRVVRLSFVA